MYVALLGARTIIAATSNVNPAALKIKELIERACAAYKSAADSELPEESDEDAHAAGN
jgi:hypothetical protein